MKSIDINEVSERKELIIRNGINTYLYIMKNHLKDDNDFREVYYEFYLKARSSVFAKEKTKEKIKNPNWDRYFNLLHKSKGNESLESIVQEIHDELRHIDGSKSPSWEFSFATKLLHTKNDTVPIFDSKVKKYLTDKGVFKTMSNDALEKILENWERLKNWYKSFLETDEAAEWIRWFDNKFPEGKGISDVKKIDFIIFACVDSLYDDSTKEEL